MSISKLHIFSKKTDNPASTRGIIYQILKTQETWIDNLLNNVEEEIYCDFEEDIFQKNILLNTVKFRQIKLYSSKFSFKSVEIEKCLFHFFMLHIKTNHSLVSKEFIFETNSGIVGNYRNNDAKLLQSWVQNQNNISDDLLKICIEKVKSIVSKKLNESVKKLKGKGDDSIINEALQTFGKIPESEWLNFTKSIKWKFNNKKPDEECAAIELNIKILIQKLPFKFKINKCNDVFNKLYQIVSFKASEQITDDRKLTQNELQNHLIASGNNTDKWYLEIYKKWDEIKEVKHFSIGEFFEVREAIKYCRKKDALKMHDEFWLNILLCYINLLSDSKTFQNYTIYEFLFLKFRPAEKDKQPLGELLGCEELVRFYFNDFGVFKNAEDLENALSILFITCTAMRNNIAEITFIEILDWFKKLNREINKQLRNTVDPNQKCQLLSELIMLKIFISQRKKKLKVSNYIVKCFKEILEIIENAYFFNTKRLKHEIDAYIKYFITTDTVINTNMVSELQSFAVKLSVIVQEREKQYNQGYQQIEWGIEQIKTEIPEQLKLALNNFHKAKDKLHSQEFIETYVLAIINISQLYKAIGLNFAAKYYSLSSVWEIYHNSETKLTRLLPDTLGLLFDCDFSQGSWFSAILDFRLFILVRHELNPNSLEINNEKDDVTFHAIQDISFLFFATQKLSPQFQFLISSNIEDTGYVGIEHIKPFIENLEMEYSTEESLQKISEHILADFPLNDVGKIRTIRFHVLGILWEISFENDYQTNSIAEEFLAMLQIVLCEISISEYDFHFPKSEVQIELAITNHFIFPQQLNSKEKYKWKVFIQYFENTIIQESIQHTSTISQTISVILNNISLLKSDEFSTLFLMLFEEKDLLQKSQTGSLYQKMYRKVFDKNSFDALQRENFEPIQTKWNFPKENDLLKWKNELSNKYNHEKAIAQIHDRYVNSYNCIRITIEKLKQENEFHLLLNAWRKSGLHDWQIITAILNFVIQYKAKLDIKAIKFENVEKYLEALQNSMIKYLNLNEKDCFIEFPIESFKTEAFKYHLNNYPNYVLGAIGLENKSGLENSKAIKELLDIWFNMVKDITNKDNPLLDF